ncbi:MAG: MFS transporter [Terrimicrobiaceae bacterium]|nr:MFS transporter [Terrimicrobiaceae bacterium]
MSVPYPKGSFNAHWFNLFNAISFQIIMGAPIIVYAKSLGASSTVLGIIAAFTPLMTVFQLPAAQFLDRFGYRQFVLMGWGLRSIFVFLIAAVPVMLFLDDTSKLAVILASLFVFNLLRGISSAAWMPWIASLIPEETRGRFLSTDQIFMNVGCLLSLVASAVVMTGRVDPWEYSLVFLISAVSAVTSLSFIKRIPEVATPEAVRRSSEPVPWRAMLGYAPFRDLLVFNIIFMAVIGSLGVFTVEYLREFPKFDVSTVLYLSGLSFIGALTSLPFTGRLVDEVGSKPVMAFGLGLFGLVISIWFLIAAGLAPASAWLIGALNLLAGVAGSNFNLANVRIVMATMPEMGRNHFFALFTVITSLGLGASPIVWGISLDVIGTFDEVTGAFHWRRHSIYFAALFLLNIIAILFLRRLHETRGGSTPSLIYARLRRAGRFWHR